MFLNVLVILIALFVVIYTYFKWTFGYWKRKGVAYLDPKFPIGNITNPLISKQPMSLDFAEIHKKMKMRGEKYCGFFMFHEPVFMPIDPELIKSVCVKEFNHFMNHGMYYNEKDDPLSAHLFAIEDDRWKNLRQKLSPTFTSIKMKFMFQTLLDCSIPLQNEILKLNKNGEELDIKELVAKFTTDVICSCAFGIECNSFKNPDAEFRRYGRKALEAPLNIKILLLSIFPNLFRKLGVGFNEKDVCDFFFGVIKETVNQRESSDIKRNDFMQLLIDLKNGNKSNSITLNELGAQAYVFFLAGFETSSTTLTFCFYELAKHPEVQNKVHEDIQNVLAKHDGKITYESLQEMKYVEQTLNETLRMYPPLPTVLRVCNKDYKIPGTNIIINKGTKTLISAIGLQYDPEYYPEPERFMPERFSEENKPNLVPFTYLPFGEGPRQCIGLRFGMMQAKVGLVSILKDYSISLSSNTPTKITMDPKNFVLTSLERIYLKSKKIK